MLKVCSKSRICNRQSCKKVASRSLVFKCLENSRSLRNKSCKSTKTWRTYHSQFSSFAISYYRSSRRYHRYHNHHHHHHHHQRFCHNISASAAAALRLSSSSELARYSRPSLAVSNANRTDVIARYSRPSLVGCSSEVLVDDDVMCRCR